MTINGLPDEIVKALRWANDSVERSTAEIRAAYELAEHSGDYSDADEMAADRREGLHDAFEALLSTFRQAYPDVFGGAL